MPRHNDEAAEVCLRCGEFGHDMTLCKYEYSQEDLKDIKCYVCKSLGHLCCIEPSHSPSWTVSCYRCGQLGHTGLASCFICEGEGHFEHQCPNSSSVCFPENSSEEGCFEHQGPNSSSVCFQEIRREEGYLSSECPNSSGISSTLQGRKTRRLCYECKGKGHIARDCPNSSQEIVVVRLEILEWVCI
ncbi:DNA-binding protein HEXBP isoform X2 [Arabidopsis lyrata subsp. lyrata]|uniref:DNA-binding protein HEXBP isoform X2 n=1 Tax=Arabidopsis lyrata subsp. lyrata TaxID=81972 RepID=UPI000A29CA5F|nr:DNA-binding protein HEXBP isoform X2 [Arabidopsis lyrata subsp. lyrata]XP_020873097.1 DNA-binding protein HEXBP isoform X2 [Arabidopsis lyrata subsp. lyrata]|eukprot:XP_020873096.1 DNA-binding protein HEXBP isoform X2 [Arabidopsis lyrata subsp. lyrata]